MSGAILILDFTKNVLWPSKQLQLIRSENGFNFYSCNNETLYELRIDNGDLNVREEKRKEFLLSRVRHVFSISENSELLIASTPQSIRIYIFEDRTIMRVFDVSTTFKYEISLIFGRFFDDFSKMGAIAMSMENKVNFFEIINSNQTFDFKELTGNKSAFNEFCSERTKVMLTRLKKDPKEMLLSMDDTGLCVFEFDAASNIQYVMKIKYLQIQENHEKTVIFFANLSGNDKWMDMLALNSSGLFVFEYQEGSLEFYELINYSSKFSEENGWTQKHTQSLQFVDVNNDGFDDAVFTGPEGIEVLSYDVYSNSWRSLLYTGDIWVDNRHSTVLYALPQLQGLANNSILLTYHSHRIHLSNIITKPLEVQQKLTVNEEFPLKLNGSSAVPKIRNQTSEDPRSIIYLRDQNIWFQKLASINPQTGKPIFNLNLVGNPDSMIKFHLNYNSEDKTNTPFGLGWSMAQNCIILNYQEGNLQDDELYFIVIDGIAHKLTLVSTNTTYSETYKFQIENQGNKRSKQIWEAKFYPSSSMWLIDSKYGRQQYFGTFLSGWFGATLTKVGWKNWRGHGFDKNDRVERPHCWYLAISKAHGISTYFEYDVIREEVTGAKLSYNAKVSLRNIHNTFTDLTFFYSNNHVIKYAYKTKTTQQTIHFKYNMSGNYLLAEISQESDYTSQPIVQFKYCEPVKGKQGLQKVILPTGIEIVYNYKILETPKFISEEDSRKVAVADDYNVSYGSDFILVSHIRYGYVILHMYSLDLSEEIYPLLDDYDSDKKHWPKTGENAEAYEILLQDFFFAIVVYNSPVKTLCLFGRGEDTIWVSKGCSSYSEESTILKGNNFILISDPSNPKIVVLEWVRAIRMWKTTEMVMNNEIRRTVAVHGNKFVIYNDDTIYLAYKEKVEPTVWILKDLVFFPGLLNETFNVLKKFDFEFGFEKALFGFFKNNALKINQNIIVLSSLAIQDNKKFVTNIRTYILRRDYEIDKENRTVVNQDHITELESAKENTSSGMYTVKYSFENDKFKIVLGNLIKSHKSKEELETQIVREMNTPAKRFLLDLKNYYVSLQGSIIKCRNITYSFGGEKWHRIEKKTSLNDSTPIVLGDKFILDRRDPNSTINLYDSLNKTMLFKFDVWDTRQLQINYPGYIAFQRNRKPISVIEFFKDSFKETVLRDSKKLSRFANPQYLVVDEPTKFLDLKTLHIYPIHTANSLLPDYVVFLKRVYLPGQNGGSKIRDTGYIYQEFNSQLFLDTIYYSSMIVVPGNNQYSFGYLQITANTVTFFDAGNSSVKRIEKEVNAKSAEIDVTNISTANMKLETILYSGINGYEIADFAPFPVNSDVCGFVGFEEYEQQNSNWEFDKTAVINGNFSLTGNSYLQLRNSSMKGTFRIKFQNQHFVASCWIRTPIENIPSLGDIVPSLIATVMSSEGKEVMNLLADVKYQMDDWSYLEVVLDLEFTHLILKSANLTMFKYLQLDIKVSPSRNLPVIDLDHVRFSPLINVFKVNVYDGKINKPIAIIQPNGAIIRLLYDKYQIQIAEINESNQVKEFITYTKGSYDGGPFQNPPCSITITPEKGFYEWFSPFAFQSRWSISNPHNWDISIGKLRHHTKQRSNIILNSGDIDEHFYGVRFLYTLTEESFIHISLCIQLQRNKNISEISLREGKSTKQTISTKGEILLVISDGRVIVWINGGLYFDRFSFYTKFFVIEVSGKVALENMIVFSRPQVQVIYKNALNEDIQKISLSSATSAIVNELLYDELGRQRITVQPVQITRTQNLSLMAYITDFVTNDDPKAFESIWNYGILKGEVTKVVGHEYAYTETVYDKSPLNRKLRIGRPGRDFSVYGQFARRFNSSTTNNFIKKNYPRSRNFSYEVEFSPYEEERISVYSKDDLKIATYIHLNGKKDLFSTFDYDERGLMIKCRTPMYYYRFGHFDSDLNLSEIERIHAPHPTEITIDYDANGNPIRKSSPDTGPQEKIYDDQNQLRFSIQYLRSNPRVIESIAYFKYDTFGRLSSTGKLKSPLGRDNLLKLNVTEDEIEFQRFYYSDNERDPTIRNRILRTITSNLEEAVVEESIFDAESNMVSKRYIIPNGSDEPQIFSINKQFHRSLLKKIIYPATMFGELFQVTYQYDKFDRIISVGVPGQPNRFISIEYDAENRIIKKSFSPLHQHKFDRNYKYNEVGYLIQINDPFLHEDISYTDKAYGRKIYGDGTVARIKFTAKWHNFANSDGMGVRENSFQDDFISQLESQECYHELKREGYLDEKDFQTKIFYPNLDSRLSFACTNGTMKWRVKEILGKYGFPKEYGYRFDYGHYRELKIAKYFVGGIEPEAFQSDSFARLIEQFDAKNSMDIWNLLKADGYIIEKENSYPALGRSFVRDDFVDHLKSINPELKKYTPLIKKLLIKRFSKRKTKDISVLVVKKILDPKYPNIAFYAEAIRETLLQKGYLQDPLEENFTNLLSGYSRYLNEIVEVLQNQLGIDRTEFDVETREIDPNGNRIQFCSGFDKYTLTYENNSNRLFYISKSNSVNNKVYENLFMHHDNHGNVIQSLPKGIFLMHYHPVTNRLEKVEMTNGNVIIFHYDSKGERFFKKVTDKEGKTKSEMHYLRDENGRTLVERKVMFVTENQEPDMLVTMYVYGPKSLIGFIQRDQFYSVFTDHQGSVRLILRDGEVVAAYDYMPYGELMRAYQSTPQAYIPYLFTGQEWDPEIGLYNFHARFYDPSIGRFYQIDPIMQYFNPYKYASNSPVSMVDPTGTVAIWFVVVVFGFAILGAYIDGAGANRDLNILNWDWFATKALFELFAGAVTGALIPIGFSGSVAVLKALQFSTIQGATLVTSLGIYTMYLNVGFQSNEWNAFDLSNISLQKIKYGLTGFSMGVNLLTHNAFNKFLWYGASSILENEFNRVYSFKYSENFVPMDFPIFPLHTRYNFNQKRGNHIQRDLQHLENLKLRDINGFQQKSIQSVFIDQMDIIYRDSYYNFLSIALLRANVLRTTNITIGSITRASQEIISKRVNDTVSKKLHTFSKEISSVFTVQPNIIGTSDQSQDIILFLSASRFVLSSKIKNTTLVYTKKHFLNPFFLVNSHGVIGIKSVPSNETTFLISNVEFGIFEMAVTLEKIKKNLIQKDVSEWISNSNIFQSIFGRNYRPYQRTILKLFKSNSTKINKNAITAALQSMKPETRLSRPIRHKYLDKQKQVQYIQSNFTDKSFNYSQKQKLSIERQFLEISIKNLKIRERVVITNDTNNLINSLWNKCKEYQLSWMKWYVRNIAEPPRALILSPSKDLTPQPYRVARAYQSTKNFQSLASYKIEDIPDLAGFQKCYTCIRTATKTRLKVFDITWLTMLNEASPQILTNASKQRTLTGRKNRKRRFVEFSKDEQIKNNNTLFGKLSQKLKYLWCRVLELKNWKQLRVRQTNLPESSAIKIKQRNKTAPKNVWNIVELGDEFLSQIAFNETILLAELFFLKCRKQKLYRPRSCQDIYDFIDRQQFACKVIQLYDECLKASAYASRIRKDRLDTSTYHQLYVKILQLAAAKSYDEISALLMEHAFKALPGLNKRTPERLSRRKYEHFKKFFTSFHLTSKIDEILIEMDGLLEDRISKGYNQN